MSDLHFRPLRRVGVERLQRCGGRTVAKGADGRQEGLPPWSAVPDTACPDSTIPCSVDSPPVAIHGGSVSDPSAFNGWVGPHCPVGRRAYWSVLPVAGWAGADPDGALVGCEAAGCGRQRSDTPVLPGDGQHRRLPAGSAPLPQGLSPRPIRPVSRRCRCWRPSRSREAWLPDRRGRGRPWSSRIRGGRRLRMHRQHPELRPIG